MVSNINSQYIQQIFEKKINHHRPIVFFDRDGVITKKRDFLLSTKDISLYKSTIKAIQLLNSYQFSIVVITNQPIVARGWITSSYLKKINLEIYKRLRKNHAFVNAIYSCPHHPQANLTKYRVNCMCRKPGTLLIEQALQKFKTKSQINYLIGDKTTDIKSGKDAGLKTFLVRTGYGGRDKKYKVEPDFIFQNALDAVRLILRDFTLSQHTLPEHR